jgi:hypothetical protein
MSFQAQRCKFAQLLVAGKISAPTFEEWNTVTRGLSTAAARSALARIPLGVVAGA